MAISPRFAGLGLASLVLAFHAVPNVTAQRQRTPAAPCVARPGGVTIPAPPPGARLSPEQALQAEIRQLTASIDSGTLSGDACLKALRRRGYLYATSGAGGLARRDLDTLIAIDPRDRDAHFFKALSTFVGAARLSLPSFTRVIELRPDDAEAYAGRGWANLVEGSDKEAIGDFGQVLRLAPGDVEALRGRAWGLVNTGDYDRAIADLNVVLKRSHAQPEAFLLRGVAYYFEGRIPEARGDWRSAMRFRPVPNGARTYGSVRFDNWRRYAALQRLVQPRVKQNPRDVLPWLASGAAAFRAYDDGSPGGLIVAAQDAFKAALAIDPANIDALMMRAASYSAPFFGYRPDAAIADLSEVIRLNPNYAEAYVRRALVYGADKPSLRLAISDAEKALALVPGDPGLRALVNKLKQDQIAWEAQQRAADMQAAAQARAKEDVAALFLAGIATAILTSDPPTSEERSKQYDDFIRQMWMDLLMERPCRTSTGRPC
jgi:tetratricopeptide (TPR) repeat protein